MQAHHPHTLLHLAVFFLHDTVCGAIDRRDKHNDYEECEHSDEYFIEIILSIGRESSGYCYRDDRGCAHTSLSLKYCISDPVLHISKALLRVLQILVGLWGIFEGVPDWPFLIRYGLEPGWPQVIKEKFELVLVLLLILMEGETEANSLMVIIVVHFIAGDILIEGRLRFKLLQNEPPNTLFNSFLEVFVSAEIFYVLIGKVLAI